MLSDKQKDLVKAICSAHSIPHPEFKDSGCCLFSSNIEIADKVQKAFPKWDIADLGYSPTMEERPDDMRYGYWVLMNPDFD